MAQNQQQVQLEQMSAQAAQANQVVHVRMDSDTQLEELFRHALDRDNMASSWQAKKLPASFFTPPGSARGNHSREGSADSTHQRSFGAPSPSPGLQPIHQRSRSSPAQLPTNILSAVPLPPQHLKQVSADFTNSPDVLSQLQPPSSQANSSNHMTLSPQNGSTAPQQGFPLIPGLGPLPTGWEQAVTPQGEVYFINHMDKSTSWYDPRIRNQAKPVSDTKPDPTRPLQRPGMGLQQLQQLQNQIAQQALQRQQQQQQQAHAQLQQPAQQSVTPGQSPTPTAQQQSLIMTPQRPPPGPPQSQPSPQQQQAAQQAKQQQISADQQIQQQLQRIRIEQEELTKKQEQLKRQEILLASVMQPAFPQPDTSQAGSQSNTTSVSTSGVDPFLGQAGNSLVDSQHARQSSGDSGLGGMGTSYSLPRTPEDFLTVEEMERDMADSGHKLQSQSGDFQMDGMQSSMDVSGLGDSSDTPTGMDSDDLVPSLQEDLGSDLLNEVDLQKMDNTLLTWL